MTNTEPAVAVTDVDEQIRTAEEEVTNLENRVIDGDTKISADTIRKAREKLNFLGLRRKAAERAEEKAAEAQRQKAIDAFKADRADLNGRRLDELRALYAATVSTAAQFRNAVGEHVAAELALRNRASRLGLGDIQLSGVTADYLDTAVNEAKGRRPVNLGYPDSSDPRHHLHALSSTEQRDRAATQVQAAANARHDALLAQADQKRQREEQEREAERQERRHRAEALHLAIDG